MDLKGAEIRNVKDLCVDIGAKDDVPVKINIPYYQRPYSWTKEKMENLINDFYKNKQENQQEEYFVGSVVLVKNARGTDRHDVIDGQQRITTVFLMNYLKFLILRAYIEEIISIKRTSIDGYLKDFEECYRHLVGVQHFDSFADMHEKVVNKLDIINDVPVESRDEIYQEILKQYQEAVGLPKKDLSDLVEYRKSYEAELKFLLESDSLSLEYSRYSYNEKLKTALSKIMILISKDKQPEISVEEHKDEIVKQYVNTIKNEFCRIKELVKKKGDSPLDLAKKMFEAIEEMLKNIKFCVIVTGNEKDAYTLFEVLNDRALEISDLDLIKNLYFKEYCNKSGDSDEIIDKNIEKLDEIWGDEIFTSSLSAKKEKLISYLGTVYLTADEDVFKNKIERYRQILENRYLRNYDKESNPYVFNCALRDVQVYQMIKTIIDEFGLPIKKAVEAAIRAECDTHKSITYKTLHLLNALGLDGVLPALFNIIIKKYVDSFSESKDSIEIEKFKNYIKKIMDDSEHKEDSGFYDIHRWSYEIWKATLYAKDYNIPRDIAKNIISKVNNTKYDLSSVVISVELAEKMQKELKNWVQDWQYGNKTTDFKAKILFINLFMTERTGSRLLFKPAIHTFVTDKLQLDHMEANNPNPICLEKYFMPNDLNEKREKYVNSIGNFMILDSDDNNNKDNKPLVEALYYYDNMCSDHWLINEVREFLKDEQYSVEVSIDDKRYRKPNEVFFTERRTRILKYFQALLNRKLDEKEMLL